MHRREAGLGLLYWSGSEPQGGWIGTVVLVGKCTAGRLDWDCCIGREVNLREAGLGLVLLQELIDTAYSTNTKNT